MASEVGSGIEEDLARWLGDSLGPIESVQVEPTTSGHVNTTLLVDVVTANGQSSLVVKYLSSGGTVFRLPGVSEVDFLEPLASAGAPVPQVLAVKPGPHGDVEAFAMQRLAGTAVVDDQLTSYVGGGWLAEADAATQAAVWESFHDALAKVHLVDPSGSGHPLLDDPHAVRLGYWRRSLADVTDVSSVPCQVDALDWLLAHAPPDVDQHRSFCMGDSRLANAVVAGSHVTGLVDWEIGYVGDPAADIAYSLYTDEVFSTIAGGRLVGLPSAEATWSTWEQATGRAVAEKGYWKVHSAVVLSITATRAITGMLASADDPDPVFDDETMNPFATQLPSLIEEAIDDR